MANGWIQLSFASPKLDALREQFRAKATRLEQVLFTRVQMLTYVLQSKVVAKLANQVLHVRTGVLRGSVNANTSADAGKHHGHGTEFGRARALWRLSRNGRESCLGNPRDEIKSPRVSIVGQRIRCESVRSLRSPSAVTAT